MYIKSVPKRNWIIMSKELFKIKKKILIKAPSLKDILKDKTRKIWLISENCQQKLKNNWNNKNLILKHRKNNKKQRVSKGSEETASYFYINEIYMHFLAILLRNSSKPTIMTILSALLFCWSKKWWAR